MLKKLIPFIICLLVTGSVFPQENPIFSPDNANNVIYQKNSDLMLDTNLYVQGVWSRLNNLPKAIIGVNSYYYSVTNKIFICGGLKQSSVPNDTCWWYDITSNTYQQAASLPQGRWSGKLVRVKDNLYLVGSVGSTFNTADGIIYKYSLPQNTWSIADTMPAPFLHEAAVCVINDSLIITIGGSINGFTGPKNLVRIYNPAFNSWQNSTLFPVNITTAHSEVNILSNDTSIYVVGGYNAGNLNTVFKGKISVINSDTILITWLLIGSTPFGTGVYRVAGAKWNDYMLFGPAMNGSQSINNIWGLSYNGISGYWTKFLPVSGDTVGNISTFAVKSGTDSNYFYLFGGFKNPNILNTAQKYSFITPPPIGIISNNNIPKVFKLYQNYPNPFNPVTKIRFDIGSIKSSGNIKFSVFDILGKTALTFEYSNLTNGTYEIEFDGKILSSGIYFYSVSDGFSTETKKMLMIK